MTQLKLSSKRWTELISTEAEKGRESKKRTLTNWTTTFPRHLVTEKEREKKIERKRAMNGQKHEPSELMALLTVQLIDSADRARREERERDKKTSKLRALKLRDNNFKTEKFKIKLHR